MDLYARINVLAGRAVRLPRGDIENAIALDADPVGRARSWQDLGADFLHIVDLDAATYGDMRNRELISDVVRALDIPVQVAGGIRSETEAERLMEAGAWRIVMGTAAIENQNMVWNLCRDHPDRIVVSLDVMPDEELVVKGWTQHSGRFLEEVLVEMSSAGVAAFLVTEARRDALTEPPNFEVLQEAIGYVDEPVIAAGGVRNLDDLAELRLLEADGKHLAGVIVGREVTEGRFKLTEAKELMDAAVASTAVEEMQVALHVADLEASVAFYREVIGLELVTRWEKPSPAGAILRAGEGKLVELLAAGDGSTSGLDLQFFVGDADAVHERLAQSGVPIARGLEDNPWGTRSFAVEDPNGIRVWFAERT